MTTNNLIISGAAAILSGLSSPVMAQPVNAAAPVTCIKAIRINASPEKVWSVLTDINNWSSWQPDIKKAFVTEPITPGVTFGWVSGGANIHSTLHTVTPLKAFGWKGKSMGILAIHNWSIEQQDDVVTLRVNESMEGFVAKMLKGYLNKNLDHGLDRWLMFLKQECERS
jgi:hypothetical protein